MTTGSTFFAFTRARLVFALLSLCGFGLLVATDGGCAYLDCPVLSPGHTQDYRVYSDPSWPNRVIFLPFDVVGNDELPSEAELTARDLAVANVAWSRAYPILWAEGMRLAHRKMASADQKDREDVVARAILDFQQRLYRRAREEGESA